MNFKEAYELPIGKNVEKKGKFSYLSWSYAVRHLRENFPTATWRITHHEHRPYIITESGCFVEVTVIVDGLEFMQVHPVLDHRNKTVSSPDAFQVNTSIQRCLAKAIGLATGIGLGLYAGEDLPVEPEKSSFVTTKQAEELTDLATRSESDCDKLFKFAGSTDFATIPESKYNQLKNMLNNKIKAMTEEVLDD